LRKPSFSALFFSFPLSLLGKKMSPYVRGGTARLGFGTKNDQSGLQKNMWLSFFWELGFSCD